ncbi:hypothetical protein LWJ20_005461 [Salmonella enterica]|nr:hypothetical protein [Salmonella enterica]
MSCLFAWNTPLSLLVISPVALSSRLPAASSVPELVIVSALSVLFPFDCSVPPLVSVPVRVMRSAAPS